MARMTASYVLVTFAAVIVVEALTAALVIPDVNREAELASRVVNTANQYVTEYGNVVAKAITIGTGSGSGAPPPQVKVGTVTQPIRGTTVEAVAIELLSQRPLGDPGLHLRPGEVRTQFQGVRIPRVRGSPVDSAPMSLVLVLSPKGLAYGSSYPGRYAPGTNVSGRLPVDWSRGGSAVGRLRDGRVAWAAAPVLQLPDPDAEAAPAPGSKAIGFVYVQVPVPTGLGLDVTKVQPLLQSGAILLLVTVPVGVAFGTLTTRAVVRRLRRLAAGTVGFAGGDFSHRVPESGRDEVGQLERHFNAMAGRLSDSIEQQRALAERNARLAERSRISRELHDSISQDLFSMRVLVGGLRRALPADASVQTQLETLSRTVGSTIQEMRALLLELRPSALEEQGLVPALADLCASYELRVGVRVASELETVTLGAAAEQALYRIVQEGLSNAARHSEAERIEVRLRRSGDHAELTVSDDGHGFSPETTTHGLGLRLMGERVRELGGSLAVDSAAGRGTVLRVLVPVAGTA